MLADLIKLHHAGVGEINFWFTEDYLGAPLGSFIWLNGERSSPYDDPYGDVIVSVNRRYETDSRMKRFIEAKELMQVFDSREQRAGNSRAYRDLVREIESNPIFRDASEPYRADRVALWLAIIALVPPWIRQKYVTQWADKSVTPEQLANLLLVPPSIVASAMGDYYDIIVARVLPPLEHPWLSES